MEPLKCKCSERPNIHQNLQLLIYLLFIYLLTCMVRVHVSFHNTKSQFVTFADIVSLFAVELLRIEFLILLAVAMTFNFVI